MDNTEQVENKNFTSFVCTASTGVEVDDIKQVEDENFTSGVSTADASVEVDNTEKVENENSSVCTVNAVIEVDNTEQVENENVYSIVSMASSAVGCERQVTGMYLGDLVRV